MPQDVSDQFKLELKRKDDLLKRKEVELTAYLNFIAHELMTPLTAVNSYLTLVEDSSPANAVGEVARYFQRLHVNLERMERMVNDLAEFARIRVDPAVYEAVPCGQLLQEVLLELHYLIHQKKAHIIIPEHLPTIHIQKQFISRLLVNLLTNSIKYSNPRKPLEIHVGYAAEELFHKFYVQDNGIGIARAEQPRLFRLFSRLATTTKAEGSGLGLAIAKRIVEGHGGEIWVTSKKGKGATFYFTLPRTAEVGG
ncbi:HAMP domain-containing histidine kinase [candidate division KSB1 bacterium]|nr:HAMP domain-containing histidine kinase [candidate division KSB1 bacterium]